MYGEYGETVRLFERLAPVGRLPASRALVLIAAAVLLAAADALPENQYVDREALQLLLATALAVFSIAIALQSRGVRIDVAEWRNRLVVLVITLAVSAAAAEFMTRWAFRDVTTSSDNGGYFSRRWYRMGEVRENSHGFRGPEFQAAKPAGIYRIAVVGDSFTFGNGVKQGDRYTDLLQARLPSQIEVLNFGEPGANTPQHRQRIERLLREIGPDFILLQWYVNDVEGNDSSDRPVFHPLMPIPAWHDWLNTFSALYTVANMQWAQAQIALGMTSSYPDYLRRRLEDPNSRDSISDRDMLRDAIDASQRAGVPIGIVLFPDTSGDMAAAYPFQYLHDRVAAVCVERRITCLDLREDFSHVRDRASLWANRLDHHPGAAANQIAAQKILETYSRMWVASPVR
jgi:hypothetical protein